MLRFADGSLRYMTVHEAKLIQTFPSDYRVTGSWGEALRQIGNAVPVKLAQCVGGRLHQVLVEDSARRNLVRGKDRIYASKALRGEQMLLAVEQKKAKLTSTPKNKGMKGKTYSAKKRVKKR